MIVTFLKKINGRAVGQGGHLLYVLEGLYSLYTKPVYNLTEKARPSIANRKQK